MATKLDRVMTYNKEFPLVRLHDPSNTWFCELGTNLMLNISTYTRPIATKHGKVVTYHGKLPLIHSNNPLNMWSGEVTWQIRNTRLFRDVNYRKMLQLENLHDLNEVTIHYRERLHPLNRQDLLITWPTHGHVTLYHHLYKTYAQ